MKTIGIYGGSFDPIHNGHVEIVNTILNQKRVDKVIILPCYQSPFKETKSEITDKERLELIKLAFKDREQIEIDDSELRAQASSYSYKTVQRYVSEFSHDRIAWILGTDQWEMIEDWKNADYLKEVLHFIVVSRQEQVEQKEAWRYEELNLDLPISSTEIRSLVKERQWSKLIHFLPERVLNQIRKQNLYQ